MLAATEGTVGVERTSPSQQLGEQAGEGSGGLHQTSDENPPRTPDDGGELTGEGAFQTPEGGATIEKVFQWDFVFLVTTQPTQMVCDQT